VQRERRGGSTLVMLRLSPAEQLHLSPFFQPSSLGGCWGSLGIARLSSSSCCTAKGSLGRRVTSPLETSLPACVDMTVQPDGSPEVPVLEPAWGREGKYSGHNWQRCQDCSYAWSGNTKLTFKPGGDFLLPAPFAEVRGHPHRSTGCNGNQCLGVQGGLTLL